MILYSVTQILSIAQDSLVWKYHNEVSCKWNVVQFIIYKFENEHYFTKK